MLSCRTASSVEAASTFKDREIMSASSVTSIIGTELHDQISYLPFVPYALSLSLKIYYKELRFNTKTSFTRNRVRKQLLNACTLLRDGFQRTFPAATKVADLAEQTVKEMDKLFANMLQHQTGPHSNSARSNEDIQIVSTDGVHAVTEQSLVDLDLSSFDSDTFQGMPDLDIFQYFGSDFQLEEIDAALVHNTGLFYAFTASSEGFDNEAMILHQDQSIS